LLAGYRDRAAKCRLGCVLFAGIEAEQQTMSISRPPFSLTAGILASSQAGWRPGRRRLSNRLRRYLGEDGLKRLEPGRQRITVGVERLLDGRNSAACSSSVRKRFGIAENIGSKSRPGHTVGF